MSFVNDHKSRLLDVSQRIEQVETFLTDSLFTHSMMEHYVSLNSNLLIPIMQNNRSAALLVNNKNASVSDLAKLFQLATDTYSKFALSDYIFTRDSFDFLLLCKFKLFVRILTFKRE